MSDIANFNANRSSTIWSLCILASVTPSAVLLGPLIVGGLVTELGFSPQAGGNMIFAELSGAACATFPAFYWINRVNWRKVLYTALSLMVICNLISAMIVDPWTLGGFRFLAGLGVGTVMTVTLLTSGMTSNQERVLSFWTMGQIIFAACALAMMPFILPEIGIRGFYICLGIVMLVLMLPVKFMPERGSNSHNISWADLPAKTKKYAPIGLLGLLFFFIAMGGIWNFVERMGDAAGFDPKFIGLTLSGVSVIGVVGAISSAWLSLKWGRITPFFIGIITLTVSMLLLYGLDSKTVFIISAFFFKYGWWFISPYILANITTLDSSGKLITATNFMIAFGQALGPLVVGFMLPELTDASAKLDYTSAVHVGLVCLCLCCLFFIPVIRINDRANR